MTSPNLGTPVIPTSDTAEDSFDALDFATTLVERWRSLLFWPILAGAAAVGASFLLPPTFTAKTTFLPPQQQQSSASAALAALGPLAGIGGGGLKTPGDQYVALMQSVRIGDHIIDGFELQKIYEQELRSLTRRTLSDHTRISSGRKDGLISVEVDDHDAQRAAQIANRYVDELRKLTTEIAFTEAQQRRVFFEQQLQATRDRLTAAQITLQSSGFDAGALKAEPKAAAEVYAKLKAEATATEVRLQAMRTYLNDNAIEVHQAQSSLAALRSQIAKLEGVSARDEPATASYVSKYREYKYQETLFDMLAKQFELAKLDESKDGTLIQVVDKAEAPDHKSKPKRGEIGVLTSAAFFALLVIKILIQRAIHSSAIDDPKVAARLTKLRAAWSRKR